MKVNMHALRSKRDGHIYCVIYPSERCMEAAWSVGRWVGNPDLNFTWRSAIPLLRKISEARIEYLQNERVNDG